MIACCQRWFVQRHLGGVCYVSSTDERLSIRIRGPNLAGVQMRFEHGRTFGTKGTTDNSLSFSASERAAILSQLDHILASAPFRSSKRYPALLRYVVVETLDGHAELLKERTLGVEVFDRASEYDTNADPVVRIAAGEVRKRLAQYYYEQERRPEIRIELPPGSYVAEFHPAEADGNMIVLSAPAAADSAPILPSEQATTEDETTEIISTEWPKTTALARPRRLGRMWLWLAISSAALAAAGCWIILKTWPQPDADKLFWGPALASSSPVLISLGELRVSEAELSPNAYLSRFNAPFQLRASRYLRGLGLIAPSDATTAANVAGLLKANRKVFVIRDKDATTFADLQNGPFVLIGAFSNDWTIRLTDPMRFHFDMNPGAQQWWIGDRQRPDEKFGLHRTDLPESPVKDDYAIVARFFDPTTKQTAVVLAGVDNYGTQVAGDFVSNPTYLKEFAKHAPRDWDRKNIELLITTNIVDGDPGPPRVVASYFW